MALVIITLRIVTELSQRVSVSQKEALVGWVQWNGFAAVMWLNA